MAKSVPREDRGSFTALQGQYLAFIHAYALLNRQPPAEREMQVFFRVTPPAVHSMVLTLERRGLLARTPGKARSLRVLLPSTSLPALHDPASGPEHGAAQQGDEADER